MPRNTTQQRALENEDSPSNQAAIPLCRMPSMLSRTRLIWKVRETLQTCVRRHMEGSNLFIGNFQIDTWLSTTDLYYSLDENCQLTSQVMQFQLPRRCNGTSERLSLYYQGQVQTRLLVLQDKGEFYCVSSSTQILFCNSLPLPPKLTLLLPLHSHCCSVHSIDIWSKGGRWS